jgi:hypothetical protein
MLFTKFKKGVTWLRRDFGEQLKEALDANLVVDLRKLPEFIGRDRVVENMISRGELEEANYSDIRKQTQVEVVREKRAKIEQTRQEQMDKEEAALRKAMDL